MENEFLKQFSSSQQNFLSPVVYYDHEGTNMSLF